MSSVLGICSEEYVGRVMAIIVLSCVCVLAVFGNTMVVLAFVKNRSLRSFGNYFLLSLAFSDLILGLWTFPNTISNLIQCKTWMSTLLCEMSGYLDNVILTNGLVTLAACSYDRYLVITKPLFYKRYMTRKRILAILTSTFLYSSILSLPPFFGVGRFRISEFSRTCALTLIPDPNNSDGVELDKRVRQFKIYIGFYILLTFIPPLSIMIICYFKIFQTAKKVNENGVKIKLHGGNKGVKNLKAGIMIAVIIGVYLVFVMPVSVMAVLQIIFNVKQIPKDGALVVTYLVMCNSFCNPIIYGIMNKDFRKTFRNILCCRSDRKSRQMSYRRESLHYNSSSVNGNGSNINIVKTRASINSTNSQEFYNTPVFSLGSANDLKRYFGKQNNAGVQELGPEGQGLLKQDTGAIMELSEHSTSSFYKGYDHSVLNNGDIPKNGDIGVTKTFVPDLKSFRFIWNIKSASYECLQNYSKRQRRTATM